MLVAAPVTPVATPLPDRAGSVDDDPESDRTRDGSYRPEEEITDPVS